MAEDYRVSVWGGVGMIVTEVGLRLSGVSVGWGVGMLAAQGEWLMAIRCQCGVGGRDDRRRGWLKSIGCQCGVGVG